MTKQKYYLSGQAEGSLEDIQHDMLASLSQINEAILEKDYNNLVIMASNEQDEVDLLALNSSPLSFVLLQLLLQVRAVVETELTDEDEQLKSLLAEQLRMLADDIERTH